MFIDCFNSVFDFIMTILTFRFQVFEFSDLAGIFFINIKIVRILKITLQTV